MVWIILYVVKVEKMKIFQLFKAHIPEELFVKIYTCFGIKDIHHEHMFCKTDLVKIDTLGQLSALKEDLSQYYLPCKARMYLLELTINKCITVFRQVLRLFQMTLASRQKYIKHKKTTFYYVVKNTDNKEDIHSMKVDNHGVTVNFS